MSNVEIFEESKIYMPGGVNSPVRAFSGVELTPAIIKSGKGAFVYDEDGKSYIDFVCAWGPMILGHCDEAVVKAIEEESRNAIAFGAPTEVELKLAKQVCSTVQNVDMIRFVNSGTEATMSAVKLARGFTGRDKLVKFSGCYHGHYDGFLVSAGSGVMTEGIPGSAGVPQGSISNTLVANYNDEESIKEVFDKHGEEIAAVIIEPVGGNMGVVPAKKAFLEKLRQLCTANRSLLIFDEVMSGFRVAYEGAQSLYGIKPDLVTFAKIIGGGLPSGAYGGRREIMEQLSPLGPVYQAGTMSGNPIVMAAGYATVKKLYDNPEIYTELERLGDMLESGMLETAKEKGLPVLINRCGSMFTLFFTELNEVNNYEDAKKSDIAMFNRYFKHMFKSGINIAPSQYEAVFLNAAQKQEHIERFIETFRKM